MSKKYLSLEEASRQLSIPSDELVRLRERGEIRGFADRGTWKFKQEDVESLLRRRQADSNPEVPMFEDLPEDATDDHLLIDDDSVAESLSDSDSDVRLVGEAELDLGFDSDSDVKLVGLDQTVADQLREGTDPEFQIHKPDSDSDVKLVRPDSDSDVKLPGDDSDSDVQLIGGETDDEMRLVKDDASATDDLDLLDPFEKSDSDIKLMGDSASADVTLIGGMDEPVAIDFDQDKSGKSSVLDDESGISLGSGSSVFMGESGISLEGPADSGIALDGSDDDEGITLALDGDSGITIDTGESGISLDMGGDSGISLESDPRGTVPMMDVKQDRTIAETQFEIPSLDDDVDSGYELQMNEGDTGVLDLESSAELNDAVFDLDDEEEATGAFSADDLDLEADAFEEEDLDVFDADEEAFQDMGGDQEYAPAGGGRMAAPDSEWGTLTFSMLAISSVFLLVCGAVMIDLVKNISTAARPNPVSGALLDMLGSLYKG